MDRSQQSRYRRFRTRDGLPAWVALALARDPDGEIDPVRYRYSTDPGREALKPSFLILRRLQVGGGG